ncbi:MAG TPA: hypothetical protein VIJ91_03525 [Candidatus Dormibacteraeota bacterium]
MRQRTLGIVALALLVAGAALSTGTAVVAYRTATTVPRQAQLQAPGRGHFGPGVQRPAGGPGVRPGPFQGM